MQIEQRGIQALRTALDEIGEIDRNGLVLGDVGIASEGKQIHSDYGGIMDCDGIQLSRAGRLRRAAATAEPGWGQWLLRRIHPCCLGQRSIRSRRDRWCFR